jgi:hypothetical protein
MSPPDAPTLAVDARPNRPDRRSPLTWPPPGLEQIQGRLWRAIAALGAGGIVTVVPLAWALGAAQPFWSLGPLEGQWPIGMALTAFGLTVMLAGFATLVQLLRHAARAADAGYGSATIWETAADRSRDMGFLVMARRHFTRFTPAERERILSARLRGAFFMLAAVLWLPAGFAIAILLAARGMLTASAIGLLTFGPAVALALIGTVQLAMQAFRVGGARRAWEAEAGGDDRMHEEIGPWQVKLAALGPEIAGGGGAPVQGRSLRRAALASALLFLVIALPTVTVALTAAVGPILAQTAVPTFLSVQEMAGSAEVLRAYRLEADTTVTPQVAGEALQNVVFVGPTQRPEPGERPARQAYEQAWFTNPDVFPDPFSETAARDLMAASFASFSEEERASLAQAAAHPAHAEFERLARASMADIAGARWTLPFADGTTVFELPWPRFAALRTAGLARIARATVALSQGRAADAEQSIREVISAGFLLMDEGPTLIDNLTGVALVNMGGDALEELHKKTGRAEEAERIRWARESAALSAATARVGSTEQDIHTLLRGIPDLVERDDALRGLRWEYLATFNMLAPCINLQKTVFGPDATYDDWMERAEQALVRVPGEAALFELARAGAGGLADDVQSASGLARIVSLTLGTRTQPGSCARLLSGLDVGGGAGF